MSSGVTGLVVVDADGVVLERNAAATRLFGYGAADVVGGSVDMIVPSAYREAHRTRFEAVVGGDEPRIEGRAADLPMLCADGAIRTFPGRFTLVRDAWGTVVGAAAAFGEPTGAEPFGRDATAPEDPAVSVEVGDVDAVHAAAVARGLEIVHPLTDEDWGVRRFFVRTPGGVMVNVLSHR